MKTAVSISSFYGLFPVGAIQRWWTELRKHPSPEVEGVFNMWIILLAVRIMQLPSVSIGN